MLSGISKNASESIICFENILFHHQADNGHNDDAPIVIPVEEGAPSLEELEAMQAAASGETGDTASGAMVIVATVAALAAAGYWVYRKKK